MTSNKTATLTCRIDPALKEALRAAAALQHRSIANMVEVLIHNHCEQQGINITNLKEQYINQNIAQTRQESK